MSTETEEKYESYYVPEQSPWPIVGAVALFFIAYGGGNFIQQSTDKVDTGDASWGGLVFLAAMAVMTYMVFNWWKDVIKESVSGLYSAQMDRSFKQGMLWFIMSEVMFFAAFFGALLYTRQFIIPWLGGEGNNAATHMYLWPEFMPQWPLTTTPDGTTTTAMGAWGLPAMNTAILLTSSWTLTIAHHALKENNRNALLNYTSITALLGIIFLILQAVEYHHAYTQMGLTMGSGIYGSTFFLLTGFHGFHVTLGTIYLIVLSIRCAKGHFTEKHHFAYEAGAWYWHFVDVVWLFLFIFVYLV
ncbi:MAG: cytochrome c oxidase subunit 3 [Polaribacter sp.]|jgi:cytochrome c oxidase subunit 3